jgi:hypothetical protein
MSRHMNSAILVVMLAASRAESQSYYCEAQGVYTVCVTENGVETCEDRVATGGATGADRGGAETNAAIDCTTNLTSAVQRGNWPTGSDSRSERAFSKTSCRVTNCKGGSGAPPAPDKGGAGTSFEQLMAMGDQYSAQGDPDSAVMLWQQASQMAPKREEPYLRVTLALLRAGRYPEACGVVDQGIQAAGPTTAMRLATAECAVYRGQFDQAEQAAVALMENETDADVLLASNLVGWIGSSLRNGQLVPCGALVAKLTGRSATPGWDLTPLIAFLSQNPSGVNGQVATLLGRLQTAGVGAAADFKDACGQ